MYKINWNFNCEKKSVSQSTNSTSIKKLFLKDVIINNISKSIFGYLNAKSLRNKLDFRDQFKGSIEITGTHENDLDISVP